MSWTMPRGSRLVVVEPHADDAFLSVGSTLERLRRDGVAIDLVTVFGNSRRNREAAAYAAAIGADHYALGYAESGCGLTGPEPSSFPVTPAGLRFDVKRIAGSATTLWPLGLRHPEHRLVAEAARLESLPIRYVETPYQLVRRNAELLAELAAGLDRLQDDEKDPAVWRHAPLFKSQSMFFYYNQPERLQLAREVLVR